MKFGDIIVPPQKMGSPESRYTCQGHCPGVLSSPPSILLKFVLFFCFFLDTCVLEELVGLSDFSPHSISNQKMKLITDTCDKLRSNTISRTEDFYTSPLAPSLFLVNLYSRKCCEKYVL